MRIATALCCWSLVLAAPVLCSCGVAATQASTPTAEPLSTAPATADLGVEIMAEVENAKFAIDLKNPIAAANDVEGARAAARQLMDSPSTLFPPPAELPRPAADGATPLSSFDVLGRLLVAKGQIDGGDTGAADATLGQILASVRSGTLVSAIGLHRVKDALSLAAQAMDTGRPPDAATQLKTARAALDQVGEPAQARVRTALVVAIDQILAQPGGTAASSAGQIRNLEGQTDDLLTSQG